ncbi:MAG: Ig-like domain repeat protein [Methanobrevibacter sp.]|uniref:Ig-like domain repeat protein n=1 Tax=Methanobrevibacter sp. TaxID=66852 RepID=UPI002E775CB5|nr:Ig-like domain repeat protein [Methanobrevibacter sp.]MEE0943459.1 Ig-like domain repeat protein [Methanobrevibacter sp.]
MKFKKTLLVFCLIICVLFCVSSVAAGDVNDAAIASENQNVIENQDPVAASEATTEVDNEKIESDVISSSNKEILSEKDNGTFTALQEKINNADENATITLENDYTYDEGFSTGGISISKALTIDGKGYTINGNSQSRIFYLLGNNIVLKNINFKDCSCDVMGGAIMNNAGDCTISSCTFTNCSAGWDGGAISNHAGDCTISSCTFTNCSASDSAGGAISNNAGDCTISSCTFTDCSASGSGGAISNHGVNCSISFCTFTDCSADWGGAININNYGVNCIINSCNFTGCSADGGGAIYRYGVNCSISSSMFILNKNTFRGCDDAVFDNCWCWFGNNASNYDTKLYDYIDSWLFLDATSTPVAGVEGKSSIVFNLKLYNSTSKLITTPDIPNLPDIVFDLSATNGYLSKYSARLGEVVIFTSTIDKDGNIKASYNGASCAVTITSLNLDAPDVSKYYNGSERFVVTLSDSAHKPVSNKNVSITLEGITTTGITDNAGQFSIPLDLDPGNYIVTLSYNGVNVRSNVNVYSTVEFGNVKGVYRDVAFNATILDSSGKPVKGKEVKIKVGNLDLTAVSDSNGVVRVSPDLDAGNYLMTITNPVTGEVKSSDVVISKASSTVSISSSTFAHGVTLSANILPGNISGEVVFTINGKQDYSEDVVNSKSSITLRNMDSGKYTAVVTFKGNANYNASTSSQITFDVDEYDYVISAPDVTKDYGGPEKFNITLTKNNAPIANANVKITLNDVDYTKTTDKNGKISMDISNLDAGVYGVVVKYNSITANSVIIVNQLPTTTDLSFVKHSSDNVTLTAKITPSVAGEIVFTVNGKDYKVNITAGKAILDLPGLDDGNYSAKAVYKGATNYKSSTSNTVSFIVDKGSIFIYAPDVTKEYGGPEKFNITLTRYNIPVAGANVKITINGVEYNETTDSEGKISIDISDLKVGVYDAVVKYDSVSVKSVITVNLISTKITWSASKITTVYNGNKYLVATLIDSNKKPMVGVKVTIKLSNGKTQTSKTNAKGQVKLSANGLAPVKTYTATATFAGNATYKKSTVTAKITVKKATPKLTSKAKAFKKSVKTKKYTVTLKTNQNKVMKKTKVTLKVNGKTYYATTNAKGQATFKITKLTKKGKFNAVVTYKGNAYYNKLSKKVQIKIN